MKRFRGSADQPASDHTLCSAEQPADVSSAYVSGAVQPVSTAGKIHHCASQTASPLAASRPGQTADIGLIIRFLNPRELAHATLSVVCKHWLQEHRQHGFRCLELNAGATADCPDADWEMPTAHGTVEAFARAPLTLRTEAARSAESLKLNIVHILQLLDYYDKLMELPFHKVQRLIINGCQHMHGLEGLALCGAWGLRLGLFLGKLARTVKTLVLRATFSDENDDPCDDIMSTIVSSFDKLEVLDIPWPEAGPLVPRHLIARRFPPGLSKDINTFPQSLLEHLPDLRRLHINIHDWRSELSALPPEIMPPRVVYDCTPFFSLLGDKCLDIEFLHIDFAGWAVLRKEAFECIPRSIKWLVLGFDDVLVQGTGEEVFQAHTVYRNLRPWTPSSCRLYVLKDRIQICPGHLEKTMKLISNPMKAVSSESSPP